jgi:phosphate transport system permease protein
MMREFIGPALKSVFGSLPLFQGPVYGVGYLTASLVLAIMIFPYIISVSREALMSVPREQRKPRWRWAPPNGNPPGRSSCLSHGWGFIGSIFLGFARALGETMAVTMVIGNDNNIHASLLSPGNTIRRSWPMSSMKHPVNTIRRR